ncbi:hypothetical protein IST4116A_01209 [Burkholderia cenocepacia]|uniref:hypothetical protein n=1 Tax=Burkholderia cenocepacia TaxID=95486 RepID=UPI0019BDE1B6|nr:hypothetical protein [Burkholderia cenocepacia]CAB5083021.1 hypothetical protein IST4116B_01201 [Burkholderia cenocepacia]CAB5083700.1 hypothetical protein IST4134_01210 [Burkholderia cenocepacia]CAB5087799.1 hypothetical protein IST4113_01208 [Burkholderia cenocepacia]CAB5095822.1 hypothetical protein IST439_01248 [Burkholderia cenocepacia]CAB5105237.1 hypothetical protein IST4129_01209 [Burkholderia cenocepacia]
MFKRLMQRFVLLEGEGATDAPAGGAPAAAPAAEPAAAATSSSPTPPGNLVAEASAGAAAGAGGASGSEAGAQDAGGTGAAEGGKPGDGAAEDGAKPGEKEPVEYTDFKLPEGVQADEKMMSDFKTTAREAGLSQDQAQKLVDLHTDAVKAATDASTQLWYDTQKQWQAEVLKDPEIGGANFEPMKATVAQAIDAVGGEDAAKIRQAFDYTGAGNNPDIIRFLYRLGKAIGEGGAVASGTPAAVDAPKTAAEKLYPTQSQTNQ